MTGQINSPHDSEGADYWQRGGKSTMVKAVWNDVTLAESDETVVVEGNHYFPAAAIDRQHFKPSVTTTICPWKGTAHYYTVIAGGKENPDAAWYYPEPKAAAAEIKDHIAFWKGVKVS
jgi:uncharacterized protein (DUF427 family)